ncbi:hypothetical protein BU14_0014s0004 [Porphyra umbilicalis]|uniref:Uncharacterized protein n=1 Tax=Porphyra umbilicalis TaxID=2786 RepID=A0A1X6PKS8_PORUM|nr:hypothetical protein BU14_0014s0004 [Porphyra umbilicalis]|eukprot:OSX81449.1 hypothetical protein BU14_0014s0004 [Porphyra umbilicalis]
MYQLHALGGGRLGAGGPAAATVSWLSDGRLAVIPCGRFVRVYAAALAPHAATGGGRGRRDVLPPPPQDLLLLRTLAGHEGAVTCVRSAPPGSASLAAPVDVAAGAAFAATAAAGTHPYALSALCVSASTDGTVRLWDAAAGACLRTVDVGYSIRLLAPLPMPVATAAGAPAHPRAMVYVVTDTAVGVLDVGAGGTGSVTPLFSVALPMASGVTPDGRTLAVASHTGRLFVWRTGAVDGGGATVAVPLDAATATAASSSRLGGGESARHRPRLLCVTHAQPLTALAVHPTSGAVAVGDAQGVISVYHGVAAAVGGCGGVGDGDQDGDDGGGGGTEPSWPCPPPWWTAGSPAVLPPSRFRVSTSHWHWSIISSLAYTAHGVALLSGGAEGVLNVWTVAAGAPGGRTAVPRLGAGIIGVSVSPWGAAGAGAGSAYAVTLADNSLVVLAAADLRPTAHVRGVGLPPAPPAVAADYLLRLRRRRRRFDAPRWHSIHARARLPSTVHLTPIVAERLAAAGAAAAAAGVAGPMSLLPGASIGLPSTAVVVGGLGGALQVYDAWADSAIAAWRVSPRAPSHTSSSGGILPYNLVDVVRRVAGSPSVLATVTAPIVPGGELMGEAASEMLRLWSTGRIEGGGGGGGQTCPPNRRRRRPMRRLPCTRRRPLSRPVCERRTMGP